MRHLLILHGAIGAKDQFSALAAGIGDTFKVHLFNFSGHGGNRDTDEAFSIDLFAKEVIEYLDANGIARVAVFGYSMGGFVGMYLAKNYPQRIEKLITLATKFYWDKATAEKEIKMLDPDKIEQKLPEFAKTLSHRHGPNDWKALLRKTADLLISLGENNPLKNKDFQDITRPVLIMIGDRDKMVGLDETVTIFKAVPGAWLAVLPSTPHPIEQADMDIILFNIRRFLST